MPKGIFTFKHFTIHQENCAMKVCTDSCLFGAVIHIDASVKKILDVGSGTGLLSLMVAQRSTAIMIDGVEIVEAAAVQSENNFKLSPWQGRLKVFNTSIQKYVQTCSYKYDLIIANPPFFKKSLKSPSPYINIAHHADYLSTNELLQSISVLLSENGSFILMLPPFEAQLFIKEAFLFNLALTSLQNIRDTAKAKVLRIICSFTIDREIPFTQKEDLIIKNEFGAYTDQFVTLLKNYYTIF